MAMISIASGRFEPPVVVAKVGEKVTWNNGEGCECLLLVNRVEYPLPNNGQAVVSFDDPGSYEFAIEGAKGFVHVTL